ncbi:MAG: hypothetical protein AAGA89_05205 [Pseudomonadota bacterium]
MRRLLHALQRGGVAAETTSDRWSVWRGRDRRHRQIGALPGTVIDLLRFHAVLMPVRSGTRPILIWRDHAAGIESVLARLTSSERPFIDQLIQSGELGRDRTRMMQTARAFRQDSNVSFNSEPEVAGPDSSCRRLGLITEHLTTNDCRFLHSLLNCAATQYDLAVQYALRPSALRTQAVRILRAAADVYGAAIPG